MLSKGHLIIYVVFVLTMLVWAQGSSNAADIPDDDFQSDIIVMPNSVQITTTQDVFQENRLCQNYFLPPEYDEKFILSMVFTLLMFLLLLVLIKSSLAKLKKSITAFENRIQQQLDAIKIELLDIETRISTHQKPGQTEEFQAKPAEPAIAPEQISDEFRKIITENVNQWRPFIEIAAKLGKKIDSPLLGVIRQARTIIASLAKQIDEEKFKELMELGVPGQEFLIALWKESFSLDYSTKLIKILEQSKYRTLTVVIGSLLDNAGMNVVERKRTGNYASGRIIEVISPPLFDNEGNCLAKAEVIIEE